MRTGLIEWVKDYTETEEETPEGDQIKRFTFTYALSEDETELVTFNELVAKKKPREDHYHLRLISEPETPGLPGTFLDRTIRLVRRVLGDWEEEKSSIMSGT